MQLYLHQTMVPLYCHEAFLSLFGNLFYIGIKNVYRYRYVYQDIDEQQGKLQLTVSVEAYYVPVSVIDVPSPNKKNLLCNIAIELVKGSTHNVTLIMVRDTTIILVPLNHLNNFALATAPIIAPTPLAIKIDPTDIDEACKDLVNSGSVDPRATRTIPQTPMAIIYNTPHRTS